jgi:hypothetical protein
VAEQDWMAWHAPYDVPGSPLERRLRVVQRRIAATLDGAPPGRITVLSMCAGQGRDILGALTRHPRRDDVVGRLVELDPENCSYARRLASELGVSGIDVVAGDASRSDAYDGVVPADLLLVCGVFGNVAEADIRRTIGALPMLCAHDAVVIWTRHRKDPDLTPDIRAWFAEGGFEEVAFDTAADVFFGVGTNRLAAPPRPFEKGVRLFDFVGDGTLAWQ